MAPRLFLSVLALCATHVAAANDQVPLASYTILRNDAHPGHSVRVRRSDRCDPTVNAYAGYIDVGASHLFFQFFESRRNPEHDPVVFWTNGGPGCSSALGLYMEHGPCRIIQGGKLERNPYSWNEAANMIYIDQPVGVGFSYRDDGRPVGTTEEAAVDIVAFLTIFFEHFSHLKGLPLHLAGESYGGRYLPLFAAELLDRDVPVNLTSVILANALVDMYNQMPGAYDVQCTNVSGLPPPTSLSECSHIKTALQLCMRWYKASCEEAFDREDCRQALNFCEEELNEDYIASGRNLFDISKMCDGTVFGTLCYGNVTTTITDFLSLQSTQEELNVDVPARSPFHSCSEATKRAFDASGDILHNSRAHVTALLERGILVLVYNGDYDFVGNWPGAQRWTERLDWSGAHAFRASSLSDWKVGVRHAGMWRAGGGMAFATIHAAGHMAPYDKPEESLALLNRWLDGGDL